MSAMTPTSEKSTSIADTAKLALSAASVVLGLAGYYLFPMAPLHYRVLAVIVAVAVALFVVTKTKIGHSSLDFMREARVEVRKVVWPSRQETLQSTLIVCVLVFIVGLFLWLLDILLFWGVGLLTGQKV